MYCLGGVKIVVKRETLELGAWSWQLGVKLGLVRFVGGKGEAQGTRGSESFRIFKMNQFWRLHLGSVFRGKNRNILWDWCAKCFDDCGARPLNTKQDHRCNIMYLSITTPPFPSHVLSVTHYIFNIPSITYNHFYPYISYHFYLFNQALIH